MPFKVATQFLWEMVLGQRIPELLAILIVVLMFQVSATRGWLESLGIPGTASTVDVAVVDTKVNILLFDKYSPKIRSLVRQRCDAAPRSEERERAIQRLEEVLRDYREISGDRNGLPIPGCDDV